MLELGLKSLLAYFLGTILGSLVLGKLKGVDIRNSGSGNAGATNALRTQGKFFAIGVLIIDISKGLLATSWVPTLVFPGITQDPEISRYGLVLGCGVAVILGHVYPVWFAFRGGKGVATILGAIAGIDARLILPLGVSWFVVLLVTGYVGLASMLAGVALVVSVYFLAPGNTPLLLFCSLVTLFVVYTHRSNIVRMCSGNEHRVRRLWLFRPRKA